MEQGTQEGGATESVGLHGGEARPGPAPDPVADRGAPAPAAGVSQVDPVRALTRAGPSGLPDPLAGRPADWMEGVIPVFLEEHRVQRAGRAAGPLRPRSRAGYRADLRIFTRWWRTQAGDQGFDLELLQRYRTWLVDAPHRDGRPLTGRTVNRYLAALRQLCGWMARRFDWPRDPGRHLRLVPVGKGHTRGPLSVPQMRQVLARLRQAQAQPGRAVVREQAARAYACVFLASKTGVRLIELSRADVGDLAEDGAGYRLFLQGKGREAKDGFAVLRPEVWAALQAYVALRGAVGDPAAPLFASLHRARGARLSPWALGRIIREALRQAGVHTSGITPHSLRHTAATVAAQRVSMTKVQGMLHHARLETTALYTHEDERRREGAELALTEY